MERNLESVVTGVYPYWANVDGDGLVELDEKIIEIYDPSNPTYLLEAGGAYLTDANGNYLTTQTPFSFHNVLPLDLSSEFEEAPTQEQLKERAEKYIADNGLGTPKVSIEVSFVHLGQTAEYSYLKEVEKCDLCDTVTVEFPLYGISVKAKIIAIETDVLLERYNSVQIGDPRSTIADTIAGLTLTSATKTEVQMGNQKAADVINNTKGTWEWIDNGDGTNGGATVYDADGNGLLRITAGGMGISQDGGLTYTNAITKEGVIASRLSVVYDDTKILDTYFDYNTESLVPYVTARQNYYDVHHGTSTLSIYSTRYESTSMGGYGMTGILGMNPVSRGTAFELSTRYFDDATKGTMATGLNIFDVAKGKRNSIGLASYMNSVGATVSYLSFVNPDTLNTVFYVQASGDRPGIVVYDPDNSVSRSLDLTPITINGTKYYMFAGT
jgi:hypothetical protein